MSSDISVISPGTIGSAANGATVSAVYPWRETTTPNAPSSFALARSTQPSRNDACAEAMSSEPDVAFIQHVTSGSLRCPIANADAPKPNQARSSAGACIAIISM
jgi:hypothetical protein